MTEILTIKQTAERLGVSRKTITLWIQRGAFPHAYRLNPAIQKSPYRIPITDVIDFERRRDPQEGENAVRD